MGTGHPIHEIDFSQARIICLADVEAITPITTFIRLETGEVRWSGLADFIPELVAYFISGAFEPSILAALSESSAPFLTHVLVHPSLQSWLGVDRLRQFFANGSRSVLPPVVAVSRVDFEFKLRRFIRTHHLDYEYQLNSVLTHEVGPIDISAWTRQFSDFGEEEFPRKILPCVRALAVAEIAERLRFQELDPASHFAVLSTSGSDLILYRCWQSMHGTARNLQIISKAIQDAQLSESILVFVDAIHSGEQLLSALLPFTSDLQQKSLKIVVRPAYATAFGIRKANERLTNLEITFDIKSAMVLENEKTGIKKSELELRLTDFAVEDSITKNIVKFCRHAGAELKAIEDATDIIDFTVGLGGFGLGVTTLLAGRPSKALLPILRLGGEIKHPRSGRPIVWKPLIQHKNMSGAG